MPGNGEPADALVDTSVAVALSVGGHVHHRATLAALAGQRLGLAGHALFETFSVLTRLPPPARRGPSAVHQILRTNFPASVFLSPGAAEALFEEIVAARIAGGCVYDALVGAAAREHGLPLATRDRQAVQTYRALGVDFRLLE